MLFWHSNHLFNLLLVIFFCELFDHFFWRDFSLISDFHYVFVSLEYVGTAPVKTGNLEEG